MAQADLGRNRPLGMSGHKIDPIDYKVNERLSGIGKWAIWARRFGGVRKCTTTRLVCVFERSA